MRVKALLEHLYVEASQLNSQHVIELATEVHAPVMCDVGCGDGKLTRAVAEATDAASIDVVEIEPNAAERLKLFCHHVFALDLNAPLAIESESYDLVMTNQVIEHLYDTDAFLDELFRIAKPGASVIVSTENAASWHNIFALLLGWQPFSSTNVSALRAGIGNPFALHGGEAGGQFLMQHHRLFSLRGLRDLMAAHGFVNLQTRGSGYYPLPAWVGNVDKRHAHFITVAGIKP